MIALEMNNLACLIKFENARNEILHYGATRGGHAQQTGMQLCLRVSVNQPMN